MLARYYDVEIITSLKQPSETQEEEAHGAPASAKGLRAPRDHTAEGNPNGDLYLCCWKRQILPNDRF